MHEVFHHVLHKKCFRDEGYNYIHTTYKRNIEGKIKCDSYALKVIERQANACAAAFLMPAELTKKYLWIDMSIQEMFFTKMTMCGILLGMWQIRL